MAIGLVELGYIVGQIAALEIPPHRMQSWLKITTIVFASDSYILYLVQISYIYHYDITLSVLGNPLRLVENIQRHLGNDCHHHHHRCHHNYHR